MRSAITFDTLQYMSQLKESGMEQHTAEAITKATASAFCQMIDSQDLATKTYLHKEITDLKNDLQTFFVKCTTTVVCILGGIQTLLHFFR